MANIRLVDNTWDTSGVYDRTEEKTQDEINTQVASELVDLEENKADQDGTYEAMTVGNAEQIVSTVGVDDNTPYVFRTTGGSADVGDRKTMEIVGGTVVWNQLITDGNFPVSSPAWVGQQSTISLVDNVCEITPTGSYGRAQLKDAYKPKMKVNHKYLIMIDCKKNHDKDVNVFNFNWGGVTVNNVIQKTENTWEHFTKMFNASSTDVGYTYFGDLGTRYVANAGMKQWIRNLQLFDLTDMFGASVANYIYGLGATNGPKYFDALFPKAFYAKNTGELLSVKTSAHITRGFNAWDEETVLGYVWYNTGEYDSSYTNQFCSENFIPVVPETTYYVNSPATLQVVFYDADKKYIGYKSWFTGVFTTPAKCYYMKFNAGGYGDTYHNDICINLSWDGERDGDYEKFEAHEYSLDPSLELRGALKLDSSNNLYYDGDTYEEDGTVTRKYGKVDLGTLAWSSLPSSVSGKNRFTAAISDIAIGGSIGGMCDKYSRISSSYDATVDGWHPHGTIASILMFVDSMSAYTAEQFKTAMSGIYLVYELSESTEEEAAAYQSPQVVNDFGTEEFLDNAYDSGLRDVKIPVGHVSTYQANLRAKLEMAPDSPDGDGDYIVRQTDGVNEYVELPNELPEEPSTDGTYHLQLVIASGEPTLSWVSAT